MPAGLRTLKLSPEATKLINAGGADLLRRLGADAVRDVVYRVMIGHNLRDSTEELTRRKLLTLNAAILHFFAEGIHTNPNFLDEVPSIAADMLVRRGLSKDQKWLAYWVLGLTDKQFQNVLRDSHSALTEYAATYTHTTADVVCQSSSHYGEATGDLKLGGLSIPLDWRFLSYLFTAIGSSTLTVRGSDKSAYGKLFEHLILGSLLTIMGFRFVPKGTPGDGRMVFWLSERGAKRESDATCLFQKGTGIRFDIGFIGRGNSEITLDKVTRFEHDPMIAGVSTSTRTIIIVDRLGEKSTVEASANRMGDSVVQMSMQYWPRQVARELNLTFSGFQHPLLSANDQETGPIIRRALDEVEILSFVE
ncbi:MAG TPA: CfrBI family restriction endonuclease [Candidatus Fermentibacter daniensis]|nr:CfrBI family restriction endonuclease [Candidatus Fermentibacter daniensis]